MVAVMPEPVPFDAPEFDAFLDELTAFLNENPPDDPVEQDLSYLVSMPTGVMTTVMLSATDEVDLSGRNRLSTLQARIRARSHVQALIYEDMAAIADACSDAIDPQLAWEAAASEIRAALRLTRRSADHELDTALSLRDRLPAVLASLKAGDIDQRRATAIVQGTAHLSVGQAQAIADEILATAGRLTTGQLRERLRRLAIEIDPDDARRRHEHATGQRRVVLEPTEDGTANLIVLDAPADRAAAARRHIDRIARSLRGAGESRTMDQIRADVALDLLCGQTPLEDPRSHRTGSSTRAGAGSVHLTVDITTLAELDEHAGDLAGFGPVIADIARQIANDQRHGPWRYTVTDPESGLPVTTGTTRRRPTAGQYRNVTARDQVCVFPGCRMPAVDSDIDHRRAWSENGPTEEDNLAPLCRHDHRLKHEVGWSLSRLEDGDHEWTSPLGRTHTTSGRSP